MKKNYLVIPLFVILIAWLGQKFTAYGVDSGWYSTLVKPEWMPDSSVFGLVWTIIYILTTLAAVIAWNKPSSYQKRIRWLFFLNALAHLGWSYLFFIQQNIVLGLVDSTFILLTVLLLVSYTRKSTPVASLLLLPYLAWITFATYLNYSLYTLN